MGMECIKTQRDPNTVQLNYLVCIHFTLQFVLGPFDLDEMRVDLFFQLFHLASQPADLTLLRERRSEWINTSSKQIFRSNMQLDAYPSFTFSQYTVHASFTWDS